MPKLVPPRRFARTPHACTPHASILSVLFFALFACTADLSHAQSFEPVWRNLDLGSCFGCNALLAADLDGDGLDEIVGTAGPSVHYGSANIVTVHALRDTQYVPTWVSDWYGQFGVVSVGLSEPANDGSRRLHVITSSGRLDIVHPLTNTIEFTAEYQPDGEVIEGSVVDVDADGNLEVVLATYYSVRIFDLESGTEERVHVTNGMRAMWIADVDDDPSLEIVISSEDAAMPTASVMDGMTGETEWLYYGGFGDAAVFADVTGDAVDDVIGISSAGYITAFDVTRQTPVWQVSEPENTLQPVMQVFDADDDGIAELVVATSGGMLRGYSLNGDPQHIWENTLAEHEAVHTMTTGDMNGDGADELIASVSGFGSRFVIANLPTLEIIWQSEVMTGPFGLQVADVDGNEMLELVGLNLRPRSQGAQTLDVVSGDRTLIRSSTLHWPNGYHLTLRAVSDLDGNGKYEAVATYQQMIGIFDVQTGRLLREGTPIPDSWSEILDLTVADTDGDGIQEIVVGVFGSAVVLDSQTLAPRWQSIQLNGTVQKVLVRNVDDDPAQEILIANHILQAYDLNSSLLEWQIPTDGYVVDLDFLDYDSDGVADYVLGLDNGSVQIVDGVNRSVLASRNVSTGRVWSVNVENVDTTPEPEIIVGAERVMVLASTDLAIIWQSTSISDTYTTGGDLQVRDVDGDQRMDILLASQVGIFRYESDERYLDTTRPTVVSHSPVDGFNRASTAVHPTVTFSELIDEETLSASSVILLADGSPVATDLRFEASSLRLSIEPEGELPANADIEMKLMPAITDTSGLRLDGNGNGLPDAAQDIYLWRFTTGESADTQGPLVLLDNLNHSGWLGLPLHLRATAVDTMSGAASAIARIEAFVDDVGPAGSGLTLRPSRESYVSSVEEGTLTISTDTLSAGDHLVHVRAMDAAGNWGDAVSVSLKLQDGQAGNWTTGGGNSMRSGIAETVLQPPLSERWFAPFPEAEHIAAPIIVGGTVYSSWRDREGAVHLSAHELWNGGLLWTKRLAAEGLPNPPTYAYGRIFVQVTAHPAGNRLFGIDAANGETVWSLDTGPNFAWSSFGAPTVVESVVLFPGHGELTAIDVLGGEPLYTVPWEGADGWTAAAFNRVVYTSVGGRITAFEAESAEEHWKEELFEDPGSSFPSPPTIDSTSGLLFVASLYVLAAFDPVERTVKWEREGFYQTSAIASDGYVYVLENSTLLAIDAESGETVWDLWIGHSAAGPLAIAGRTLIIRGIHETYAVDLDLKSVSWSAPSGGEFALADGTLLVAHLPFQPGGDTAGLRAFISADRVGTEPSSGLPTEIALDGNYPNPFNPNTMIRFALPHPSRVRLAVYDVLGREIVLLVDGVVEAGHHEIAFAADNLPSGVYFARMEVGRSLKTCSMTLLK